MRNINALWPRLKELMSANNPTLGSLVARGVTGSFVLKLWYTLYSFVVSVILARVLGTEGFGNYSIAISWVVLMVTFAKLGLDQTTTRFVAAYDQQQRFAEFNGLTRFSIVLALLVGILVVAGAVLVLYLFHGNVGHELRNVLLVAFLLVPIQAVMAPMGAIPQGLGKVVRAQLPSLLVAPIAFVVLLGLFAVAAPNQMSALTVMALMVAAQCAGMVHSLLIMKSVLPSDAAAVKSQFLAKEWLASAIPVTLMGGMYVINMNADILMLGALADADSAGIYKAATRGADIVMLPSAMISLSLAPIISRLHSEGDSHRLQRGVTKTTRAGMLATAPLALLILIFDDALLNLFGSEFVVASTALWILVAAQLVKALLGPVGWLLVMTGNEKTAAIGLGISVMVNLVLNALLIPPYGVEGAALATMTSIIFGMLVLAVSARAILGIDASVLGFGRYRSLVR